MDPRSSPFRPVAIRERSVERHALRGLSARRIVALWLLLGLCLMAGAVTSLLLVRTLAG
jgi:hypothetical protein